jgi:hypothetical protein
MIDHGHTRWDRERRVDRYAHLDAGIDAARLLRGIALAGIAARLFSIFASANRISVTHTLLGLTGAGGRVYLSGQTDGGLNLVSAAHDADALVTVAVVVTLIMIALFVLALISLGRRRRRGDPVAMAVNKNPAVRLAGRAYLVAAIVSLIARSTFNTSPDAPPVDRLHTVLEGDAATIGFQIAVIGILLLIALATGREIRKARAPG